MFDLQPFKDAIYTWVKSRVDPAVTIYWMEQGAPRAPRPALSIKIVTPSTKPYDDNLRFIVDNLITGAGHYVLNGPRTMMVSFNSYGVNAIETMITLRDSVDDPDVVDQLAFGGLSIVQDGQVDNLTELLESNFETRAHMDMTFGYNVENSTNVVEIDKISINGMDIPSP